MLQYPKAAVLRMKIYYEKNGWFILMDASNQEDQYMLSVPLFSIILNRYLQRTRRPLLVFEDEGSVTTQSLNLPKLKCTLYSALRKL